MKNINEFEIRTFNTLIDTSMMFFNYINSFYSDESIEEKNNNRLPIKDKDNTQCIILLLSVCIFLNYGDDINKLVNNDNNNRNLERIINNFATRYVNTNKYYVNGNIFNDKLDILSSIRNCIAHGAYVVNKSKNSITIKDNLNRRYDIKIDDIVSLSLLTALSVLDDDLNNNRYGTLFLKDKITDNENINNPKQYIKYILEHLNLYNVKITGNNINKIKDDIILKISNLLQSYYTNSNIRNIELIKNTISSFFNSHDKYKDYSYTIKKQNIDIDDKLIDIINKEVEKIPIKELDKDTITAVVIDKLRDILCKYDDNVNALISTCVDNMYSLHNINAGIKDYNEEPDFTTTRGIYGTDITNNSLVNNNLAISSALSLYSLFVYPFNYIRDDEGYFNYKLLDFSLVKIVKMKNEEYANELEDKLNSAIKACENNKKKMEYRYKMIKEECEKRHISIPPLTNDTLKDSSVPIEVKNHLREYLKCEKEIKGLEINKRKKINRKEYSNSRHILEGIRNSIVHGNYYIKEINNENVLFLYDINDNQNNNNFECYIKPSDINTFIESNKKVINDYLNSIKELNIPKKIISTKPYNKKDKKKKKTKKRK